IADVIMASLAKDPHKREPDARSLGQAIFDASKLAGLSPDEFARPLRRQPSAIRLPPVARTKQLELTADLIERMTPAAPPAKATGANSGGPAGATSGAPPGASRSDAGEGAGAWGRSPHHEEPPPGASRSDAGEGAGAWGRSPHHEEPPPGASRSDAG